MGKQRVQQPPGRRASQLAKQLDLAGWLPQEMAPRQLEGGSADRDNQAGTEVRNHTPALAALHHTRTRLALRRAREGRLPRTRAPRDGQRGRRVIALRVLEPGPPGGRKRQVLEG